MRNLMTLILLLFSGVLLGQQITVTGVVKSSEEDMPLPGATIVVKGTSQGVISNADGTYSISAKPEDVLVYSFVGYVSQEITVGDQTIIDVSLSTAAMDIDEVIVVGYGVEKKSLVTGAIAKVNSEEIEKSNTLRVEQAIQGKTAGVSITQVSGQPGSGFTVRVRGTGSNGNSEPIFIVDGMRMGGIEGISTSDIESVEVLKDAASAAIYGADGANGVVLITTKSGKASEPRITYKYYYGIQELSNNNFSVMDADQYLDYRWRALLAEGKDSSYISARIPLAGQQDYNTNWLDEVINPAPMKEHYLSYSGGDEKSAYNASLSYLDQDGIAGGSIVNFKRLTARLNADYKLKKWLTAGYKINYSHSSKSSAPENSTFNSLMNMAILMDPLTPVTVPYDSLYYIGADYQSLLVHNDAGEYYGVSKILSGEIYNPLALLETIHSNSYTDKAFGNMYATIQPMPGLSFTTKVDFDLAYSNWNGWSQKRYFNSEVYSESDGVYRGMGKYFTWQWGNFINYDLTSGDHSLHAMIGMEANEYTYNGLGGSGTGMIVESDAFAYISTTPDSTQLAWDGFDNIRRISYIGRISYNYKEKYMITTNFRSDRSSLFSPQYRVGNFPSVSLGWIISKEDFFNVSPISFLKLRASWGQNGSTSNLSSFSYYSLITSVYEYVNSLDQLERASEPAAIANPLRWEVSEQADLGIDIGMMNNRLFFTFDFYNKLTKDLITESTSPLTYGNYNSSINAGNSLNRGVEMEVSYKNNIGDLHYDLSLNAAYNYNEVTNTGDQEKLYGVSIHTDDDNLTFFEEGYPAWYFKAYKTDGIFQTQEEADAYVGNNGKKIQPNAIAGDVKFVDVNQDGKISTLDRVMVGDPYPDWVFGANIYLEYKGLDLTMYLQGATGLSVVNALNRSDKVGMNKPTYYYTDAWDGEGSTNDWFRPSEIDRNGNFKMSDLLIEDADYLRIKTMQIGYNIPSIKLINDFHIQDARVYVSATNLMTWTPYRGIDPEIGAVGGASGIGIDYGFYPSARTYQIGVQLNF